MSTPVTLWTAMAVLVLSCISLCIGAGTFDLQALWTDGWHASEVEVLLVSRLPRTLALILAGAGLAITGLILQILVRNRFVEPSTVGTTESASLGVLLVVLLAPGMPVVGRMLVAATFALAGTGLFLLILRTVPLRSVLMVPLVGIVLSGVIGAVTTFLAFRFDLLQSIGAWTMGDFSVVLRGRYELLWIVLAAVAMAYAMADRLTVAGMGHDFATNLGLNHRSVMTLGLVIVAIVSAAVVVTVGTIPFLGLVVPNVVSLALGDNMRRSLPVVVLGGAALVLVCDIMGRIVIHPYEIPIGTTMGVLGSALFLWLLLRGRSRVA
ncbi:iron complex transport system permease protein [Loktanella fryxellensis]|uniref:Iron complex transport system permease protein n=1 Tax=Loktanella fryxellensis TaxID=245187 RepID=A0A1H8IPR0_9RHOB|nr:iron chelate uptake ABC transporter family permease subunit [Loktanella fryxellensis]SEN70399.1 iron complex transport system permease protein [Loktanella fryxellensis]